MILYKAMIEWTMLYLADNKYGKCTEYLFGKAQYDAVIFYKFELVS